jgi:ribonuclease P/MRP protein subunit RPP40
VGIIAMDLSAAFDTIAADKLVPKLERLGIRGHPLSWFTGYMTDGMGAVVWNSEMSKFAPVVFGLRQGSILGPILFLTHVSDKGHFLEIDGEYYVVYADNTSIWQTDKTWEEVKSAFEEEAEKFAVWARWNGLAMNAGKTQLLVSSNADPTSGLTVRVGNDDINCSETLELLCVGYDRKLSAAPHADNMI